ncbi:unnamed protein product, partial [Polarella glacialis]
PRPLRGSWNRLMQAPLLMPRSVVLATWLAASCLLGPASAGSKHTGNKSLQEVELPHHSFITPLQYSSLLEDWVLSGASLFE